MKYGKSYCEEKEISTSALNEAQRTLYYIAENMKMDKSISEEGYRHFQLAIKALEQETCEDAISRQAVLDLINADWKYEGLEEPINSLPPVTPQPKTMWIPVSERLPKADEYIGNVARYYLVQNEYGDMLVARYTHSEYWEQMYQLKPIGDEIVAWMPLPQPYTESDE